MTFLDQIRMLGIIREFGSKAQYQVAQKDTEAMRALYLKVIDNERGRP